MNMYNCCCGVDGIGSFAVEMTRLTKHWLKKISD